MIEMIGAAFAGWFGSEATRAQADINNRLSKLNAEVGNRLRRESNTARIAEGNLARWVQSVNNQRQLDTGGEALEQNTVNYLREVDMATTREFSRGIRGAEQLGSQAAAQAAAGVDGAVVDMVNGATALRDSIVGQQILDSKNYQAYDYRRRAGSIMSQMVGGLDNSIVIDSLDFNRDYATVTPSISAKAAAIRGAFPYALDTLAASTQGGAQPRSTTQPSYTREVAQGLQFRQRSSSAYDLADQAYDQKVKFGFKDEVPADAYSPYAIYSGQDVQFGQEYDPSYNDRYTVSSYNLWSW